MLCDDWPGIADCFEPGREILVVRSGEEVAAALHANGGDARAQIGAAFHARALRDHTYAQRAVQADFAFRECLARRHGEIGPQQSSAATMEDWAAMPGFRPMEHEEAYA